MPAKKHGSSVKKSRYFKEYQVWKAMRRRCYNVADKHFKDYQGRGISVCERWDDFHSFILDMGPCPSGYSLDRIDNDGNYEPSNCRWADKKTQAINKRTVPHLTISGQTKPAFEWAKLNGIKRSTYSMRISRGLTPKQAAFEPITRR